MMSRFVFFIDLQTEIKWENNRAWENNHASLMSDVRAKRNADHKSFSVHPYKRKFEEHLRSFDDLCSDTEAAAACTQFIIVISFGIVVSEILRECTELREGLRISVFI